MSAYRYVYAREKSYFEEQAIQNFQRGASLALQIIQSAYKDKSISRVFARSSL